MIALKEPPAPTRPVQRLPLCAGLSGRMDKPLSLNDAQPQDRETEPDWRLKHILVPTDFSPCSDKAVARAASLARHHDATLTIFHVVDINPPAALTHCGAAENLMRQLWVTGISKLCRMKESLAQSQTKTQTLIVEGLPAEAIVENTPGFDLLVMGERRSKSAWNLFARHTARRVIERAECPVLVVHQDKRLVDRELGRLIPAGMKSFK
jgi:nucleotide-binding universal stress UspA family protein